MKNKTWNETTSHGSKGGADEEETLWKPAKWFDYLGPMAPGANEGLTLMDHPTIPNHPTVFTYATIAKCAHR